MCCGGVSAHFAEGYLFLDGIEEKFDGGDFLGDDGVVLEEGEGLLQCEDGVGGVLGRPELDVGDELVEVGGD